jgi:5-methylcytosine-specific restriction endonuclease McrA
MTSEPTHPEQLCLTLVWSDEKRCASCRAVKPLSEFGKRSLSPDGLNAACRSCIRERKAGYYQRDRVKIRAEQLLRYWSDPEKARAEKRKDYVRHRDKRIDRERRRIAENDEYRRRAREYKRRHALRRKGVPCVPFSLDDLKAKVAYWGDKCWLCGGAWTHIDHVKPVSRGGMHALSNLRPACRSCNQVKNAAWPIDTRRSMRVTAEAAKAALANMVVVNSPSEDVVQLGVSRLILDLRRTA